MSDGPDQSNNNRAPVENPPPKSGTILFVLLALVPMPIGLSIGSTNLSAFFENNRASSQLIIFNVFTIICCMAGSIGMFAGFKKSTWLDWLCGIFVGIILWVVETFIISFIGCCQGLSHI